MTCLRVEGSSCAVDLVCVLLPHSVIGSRLLAAACAGGAAAWEEAFHPVARRDLPHAQPDSGFPLALRQSRLI